MSDLNTLTQQLLTDQNARENFLAAVQRFAEANGLNTTDPQVREHFGLYADAKDSPNAPVVLQKPKKDDDDDEDDSPNAPVALQKPKD